VRAWPLTQFARRRINFTSISTERGYDWVVVYDGPNAGGAVLFNTSGAQGAVSVASSRSCAFVYFNSDYSVVGSGFTFAYQGIFAASAPTPQPTLPPVGGGSCERARLPTHAPKMLCLSCPTAADRAATRSLRRHHERRAALAVQLRVRGHPVLRTAGADGARARSADFLAFPYVPVSWITTGSVAYVSVWVTGANLPFPLSSERCARPAPQSAPTV
jgi:hypothetical protein